MTTDERINSLKRGGRIILSEVGDVRVTAERSGNGRELRIVRETPSGFTVIQRRAY